MKYLIEVEKPVNDILISNAKRYGVTVESLIQELLKRYVIDKHIMEQNEFWQNGIKECADINLDWANL